MYTRLSKPTTGGVKATKPSKPTKPPTKPKPQGKHKPAEVGVSVYLAGVAGRPDNIREKLLLNHVPLKGLISIGRAPQGDPSGRRAMRFSNQQQVERFEKAVLRLSKLNQSVYTSKRAAKPLKPSSSPAPKSKPTPPPKPKSKGAKASKLPPTAVKPTAQKPRKQASWSDLVKANATKPTTPMPKKQVSWSDLAKVTDPSTMAMLLLKTVEQKKLECPHHKVGKCTYGKKCKFSHGKAAVAKPPTAKRECHSWNKSGDCERGDKCRFRHRRLCLDFAKGSCSYSNCKFLHPTDRV